MQKFFNRHSDKAVMNDNDDVRSVNAPPYDTISKMRKEMRHVMMKGTGSTLPGFFSTFILGEQ